jgi:hypothetical protein
MSYIEYNPNPVARSVGDCAVRAIAKALDMGWEGAYIALVINGLSMGNVMDAKEVVSATLRQHGFNRTAVPDTCPDCYTAEEFCEDHPRGLYVLAFGSHIATVIDGNLYDAWDSSKEIPMYYWYRKGDEA